MNFKCEHCSIETHARSTDTVARLYKKVQGDKSILCHTNHILMDNRSGLIVDVEVTTPSSTAERDASSAMPGRMVNQCKRVTLGAEKGYDCKVFVKGLPQTQSQPACGGQRPASAIDGRTQRHEGYMGSLNARYRIEEVFGWMRAVGGLAMTKLIGQDKLAGQALICFSHTTWRAWVAWVASRTRIMRESRHQCARNERNGLKAASKIAAMGRNPDLARSKSTATSVRAALMTTFSAAC